MFWLDSLNLVREPENSFDKNAIKVCTKIESEIANGEPLGYLNRDLAAKLSPLLDNFPQILPTCKYVGEFGGDSLFKIYVLKPVGLE